MSCPACGLDYCNGDCPPNQPLVYEACVLCGHTEEYDDLAGGFCPACIEAGYSADTVECEVCGVVLGQAEFDHGAKPFKPVEIRGLTRIMCPECSGALSKEQMT